MHLIRADWTPRNGVISSLVIPSPVFTRRTSQSFYVPIHTSSIHTANVDFVKKAMSKGSGEQKDQAQGSGEQKDDYVDKGNPPLLPPPLRGGGTRD